MKTTSPEPTQRLNVDLPKSQYFALKSYALHNDISVSQLVRDSLQDIVGYDAWFKARVHAAMADPNFPRRRGRVAGTLEMVAHANYVVILQQTPETVTVLDVLHAARKYP